MPQEIPRRILWALLTQRSRVSRTPNEASSRSQHGIPKERMGLTVSGQTKDPKRLPTEAPHPSHCNLVGLVFFRRRVTTLAHGTPGHSSAPKSDGPLNKVHPSVAHLPRETAALWATRVTPGWLGREQSRTGISRAPEWKCYHPVHCVALFPLQRRSITCVLPLDCQWPLPTSLTLQSQCEAWPRADDQQTVVK